MFIDFRKRGRKGERERERQIDWLPPERSPTGDRTYSLHMCSDQEQNLKPCGSWMTLQPTEQPGQGITLTLCVFLNAERQLTHPHTNLHTSLEPHLPTDLRASCKPHDLSSSCGPRVLILTCTQVTRLFTNCY